MLESSWVSEEHFSKIFWTGTKTQLITVVYRSTTPEYHVFMNDTVLQENAPSKYFSLEDYQSLLPGSSVFVHKRISSVNTRAVSRKDVEDSKNYKTVATNLICLAKRRNKNEIGRTFETFHTFSFSSQNNNKLQEIVARLYVKTKSVLVYLCDADLTHFGRADLFRQIEEEGFLSLDKAIYPIYDNLKSWKNKINDQLKITGNLEFAIIVSLKYQNGEKKIATPLFQLTKTQITEANSTPAKEFPRVNLEMEIAHHLASFRDSGIEVDLTSKQNPSESTQSNNNKDSSAPGNTIPTSTNPGSNAPSIITATNPSSIPQDFIPVLLWHFKDSSGKKKPALKTVLEINSSSAPQEVVSKVVLNPVPYVKSKRGTIKHIAIEFMEKDKHHNITFPEGNDAFPTVLQDFIYDYHVFEHLRIPMLGQVLVLFRVKTDQGALMLESTPIYVVSHVSQLPSRKRSSILSEAQQQTNLANPPTFASLDNSFERLEPPPFLQQAANANPIPPAAVEPKAFVTDVEPSFQVIGVPIMVRVLGNFPRPHQYIVQFDEDEVVVIRAEVGYLFVLTPAKQQPCHVLVKVKNGDNLIGTANYWYYDWTKYMEVCKRLTAKKTDSNAPNNTDNSITGNQNDSVKKPALEYQKHEPMNGVQNLQLMQNIVWI